MSSREFIQLKAEVLADAVDALAPTYEGGPEANPIATCSELPSEHEVLRVLELLNDVLYPGYRSDWNSGANQASRVIERLDECYDLLYRQVRRALPLRWKEQGGSGEAPGVDELEREAQSAVGGFFCRLAEIRERLKLDVVAAYNGDPAARSYAEVIFSYPGLRAVTVHRVAHELYLLDVPLIPRLMGETVHRATGIEIHPGARIGESFFIDHGTGVVIGETTMIGARVKLYQGVTLGAYSFRLDDAGHPVKGGKRHPTIEDDVVIYAGATVLGGETVIGKGAVIGSNVSLTRSVPPGSVVTMRNVSQFTGGLHDRQT